MARSRWRTCGPKRWRSRKSPVAELRLEALEARLEAELHLGGQADVISELSRLAGAHPLREHLHALRAYARELAVAEDTEDERRAALTRLFDHYLFAAAAAANTLYPADRQRRPRIPQPATLSPPMITPASAQAWLDAERPGLIAIAAHTAAHGWPDHTIRLATILFRETSDQPGQGRALGNLGIIAMMPIRSVPSWPGRRGQV